MHTKNTNETIFYFFIIYVKKQQRIGIFIINKYNIFGHTFWIQAKVFVFITTDLVMLIFEY
jgi:uncharacterized protein YrrD